MIKDSRSQKDVKLFQLMKQGDQGSFKDLFSLYYHPLCNFAFLFVSDSQLAEEIVSDVFINIWQKKEKIDIKVGVKSYLYKSTKNRIISHSRKHQIDLVSIEDYKDYKNTVTPETLLIKTEEANSFSEIVDRLPKKAGLVFRMHKVDGLKYREIADILNISHKTMENHMGTSIKHLRQLVIKHPQLINSLLGISLLGISIFSGFNWL